MDHIQPKSRPSTSWSYQSGTNLELDEAIAKKSAIDEFLKQDQNDSYTFEKSLEKLSEALMR